MKIPCPKCGEKVVLKGIGRKPFNIGVTKVCDALQRYHSVPPAAFNLNCSRAYIYKVLKAHSLKAPEVIRGVKNGKRL